MNAEKFRELLRKLSACSDAVEWAKGKSLAEVWEQCDRADWLLWLCQRMVGEKGWPSHEEIVLVTRDIVESWLHFFEEKYPDDQRPREAIEAARAWALCDPRDKDKKAAAAARRNAYMKKMREVANVVRKRLKVPQ
jgi:hypothetical protein